MKPIYEYILTNPVRYLKHRKTQLTDEQSANQTTDEQTHLSSVIILNTDDTDDDLLRTYLNPIELGILPLPFFIGRATIPGLESWWL